MIPDPQLGEFEKRQKTYLGKRRTVYYLGKDGPGVVLMEEVPGITPHVLRLAKLLTEKRVPKGTRGTAEEWRWSLPPTERPVDPGAAELPHQGGAGAASEVLCRVCRGRHEAKVRTSTRSSWARAIRCLVPRPRSARSSSA